MMNRRTRRILVDIAIVASAVFWSLTACADGTPPPPDAVVHQLMTRDLIGATGKEILLLTVEYVAGGASLPHRHNAQVFVYVLDGAVRMQIEGGAPVTLRAGDTFYEGPDDVHTISANASRTKPARILVFIVKDKGAPVSSPVASQDRR
jgi:quercetin dioxygenase-like cupin family protein